MLADAFARAGEVVPALVPGAAVGGLLLLVALVRGAGSALGWSLGLAGAVYVGALEAAGGGIDATAPLVGFALLLCGELVVLESEARLRLPPERAPCLRRTAALGILLLAGLSASTLVVALSAAPAAHGLAWTVLGAAAAVGAAGAGAWLARRPA